MTKKSNDHILEAYVHIHVKDEVSIWTEEYKKEKYQNGCYLKTIYQID